MAVYPHSAERVWRPRSRLARAHVPRPLQGWLFDTDSLTRRLQRCCTGAFRVRLVAQHWARPLHDEARRLGLRCGERALVRHVYLQCGGVSWVFARSVIPRATLSGPLRCLGHLGERSLGAVLFAARNLRRDALEMARLTAAHPVYALAVEGLMERPDGIWGRRSLYRLADKSLLVSEIFLPALTVAGECDR